MPIRIHSGPTRRRLLTTATSLAAATLARPYLSRAADRPLITHGVQSGDVSVDSAVLWARADRPSRMRVEIATTDSFKDIRHGVFVDALPETDFTAKTLIEGLPAGQDIFFRIRFEDLASPTIVAMFRPGAEQVNTRRRAAREDRRPSVGPGRGSGEAGDSSRAAGTVR